VSAREVEFDEVTLGSSQGVRSEDIARADCDFMDFSEDTREESHGSNDVFELNHFDRDAVQGM
jgi:hypothetical protein